MALYTRIINGTPALNRFLRGGIMAGKDLRRGPTYDINGKTLVFTTPSATVTFTTPNAIQQEGLALKDILAQINAVSGLVAFATADEGRLVVQNPAGTTNTVLSNTGTANALLGFDAGGASGKAYAKPGSAAPALVTVDSLSIPGAGFLVVTDE